MSNSLAKFRNSGCAAHSGHDGQSGVQCHSTGEHYPVLSYCIGSADQRVAEFCGVQLRSNGSAGHERHLDILKCAERIVDAIYADRNGGSVWVNRDDDPVSGYCVSLHGHETQFDSLDDAYRVVYADVAAKLDWINCNGWFGNNGPDVCIGWWLHDGRVYVDISIRIEGRNDAVDQAVSEGQLAIYDIECGVVRKVDEELADRAADSGLHGLNVCEYKLYRVDGSRLSGRRGGIEEFVCTVVAASHDHARFVVCEELRKLKESPDSYVLDDCELLDGYAVQAYKAACVHFEDRTV